MGREELPHSKGIVLGWLRLSLRTVPGVYTSCVTIFNTMGGGELWLFAERFLKGQEIEGLRRKSPLRVKGSRLREI
jgi:hypothetical protein